MDFHPRHAIPNSPNSFILWDISQIVMKAECRLQSQLRALEREAGRDYIWLLNQYRAKSPVCAER